MRNERGIAYMAEGLELEDTDTNNLELEKRMQELLRESGGEVTNLVSDTIRSRITQANAPFNSTDNISKFIKDGELDLLILEVSKQMEEVLKSLVINTDDDYNTRETAHRIAKMYIKETFKGRYIPSPVITAFPNARHYDQLYVTGPITVNAVCAHHFQNITGVAYIGVFPGTEVIGLSKFNRIVDWYASRPTIQEELTMQIADAVEKITRAEGVGIIIKASHSCITARGVNENQSDFTTSVLRGSLRNVPVLRTEFFNILNGMKGWKNN